MKHNSLVIRLLICSNVIILAFATFVFLSSFNSKDDSTKFKEITVERINVVNADGTPVMVIANKQRIANPVMGGRAYPVAVSEGREYMAGIIFFNETGDEMGGLVFNSFKMPNGRVAGIGHLSFDRFNDNQVISLDYNENKSGVKSGLTIFDRPGDGSFKKYLDLIDELNQKATTPERANEIRMLQKDFSEKNALGVQRLFIGSRNEMAQVELKDKKGKVKARLFVNNEGDAKLEFLNEMGDVTNSFPK